MSKPSVAILGLGASAILAAQAAKDFGCKTIDVYALKEHWTPPGTFWLHWLPPHIGSSFEWYPIYLSGIGTELQYRKLQWGSKYPSRLSSFPKKDGYTYGYNPREVFPNLMPKQIKLTEPLTDEQVADMAKDYDVVIQTFPTELSKTTKTMVYFYVGECYQSEGGPNRVIYHGTEDSVVLRTSYLWGKKFYEFPKSLPLSEIQKAPSVQPFKPVKLYDMNQFTKLWRQPPDAPANVYLIGRWAEWNPNRLSHEAYILAAEILRKFE